MRDNVTIQRFVVGPIQANCYILYNTDSMEGVLVDPGASGDRIVEVLEERGIKLKAILITHAHVDHIDGLDEVRDHYKIPVYIHEGEKEALDNPNFSYAGMFAGVKRTYEVTNFLKDGDEIDFAGFKLTCLHTPGHSKGSCCFYDAEDGVLFSGDTLFQGSVGRTDLAGGSMSELIRSINDKIMTLSDDTIVLSGHGDETSVEFERQYNPYISGRY